jgi:hypothetical protein
MILPIFEMFFFQAHVEREGNLLVARLLSQSFKALSIQQRIPPSYAMKWNGMSFLPSSRFGHRASSRIHSPIKWSHIATTCSVVSFTGILVLL